MLGRSTGTAPFVDSRTDPGTSVYMLAMRTLAPVCPHSRKNLHAHSTPLAWHHAPPIDTVRSITTRSGRCGACNLCGTSRERAFASYSLHQRACMQVVSGATVTAIKLTDRQQRTACRLRWRLEVHRKGHIMVWRRNMPSYFPQLNLGPDLKQRYEARIMRVLTSAWIWMGTPR